MPGVGFHGEEGEGTEVSLQVMGLHLEVINVVVSA